MNDLQRQKEVLRVRVKKQRGALSKSSTHIASEKITQKILLLPQVKTAKSVFVYVSYGKEVATHVLIEKLLQQGKIVCVPKVIDEIMIPMQILSFAHLQKNSYGILEPRRTEKFTGELNVAIVPGLAFSATGARLGHGKGYYDRFFAQKDYKNTARIGIAYAWQIAPHVPEQRHDARMGTVVHDAW